MNPEEVLVREEVLWLLGSLCGLHRIPFDAALVAQSYPPPYSIATLHEAARALGFKTGTQCLSGVDWTRLPFPAIVFLKPASAVQSTPVSTSPSPVEQRTPTLSVVNPQDTSLTPESDGTKGDDSGTIDSGNTVRPLYRFPRSLSSKRQPKRCSSFAPEARRPKLFRSPKQPSAYVTN